MLFIILFLHQTTTKFVTSQYLPGCLSSCSYIKPQHIILSKIKRLSCLSSCSYIKPQLQKLFLCHSFVVYHLVPTSNHNHFNGQESATLLFIILFLHQTTTEVRVSTSSIRCLSSCSYIKPQLVFYDFEQNLVVYHLVPTSNHN